MYKPNIIQFRELSTFANDLSTMRIVERDTPKGSDLFFKGLLTKPFNVSKEIFQSNSLEDIESMLNSIIPSKLKNNNFFYFWLKDMANITSVFSEIIKEKSICLALETSRGCKRYHIDNVPMRLLVTYYGRGTEWLPRDAADYDAYYSGKNNKKILINSAKKKFLKKWDIAIFKGQKYKTNKRGILHRTPDSALNKISLLMRLDSPKYLN